MSGRCIQAFPGSRMAWVAVGRALVGLGALVALPHVLLAQATTVTCSSTGAERQQCPADTSAGVALMESTGASACLLGKTWGYDDTGVWVSDGCGGEFQLGHVAAADAATPAAPPSPAPRARAAGPKKAYVPIETWGEFDPGKGFLIGRGSRRGAVHQRVRARAIREPDARRADLHRPPRERAHRRRPQRHLAAPGHGLPEGVGRATRSWSTRSPSGPCSTRTRTPSSATSATSSAGSSASTPASTGTRARARCRARTPTGSATIA